MFEDKSSYNGDWQFGLRHGHGEYVTSDGSVYRGQWINDKAQGKGTISIPAISYTYNGEYCQCYSIMVSTVSVTLIMVSTVSVTV